MKYTMKAAKPATIAMRSPRLRGRQMIAPMTTISIAAHKLIVIPTSLSAPPSDVVRTIGSANEPRNIAV